MGWRFFRRTKLFGGLGINWSQSGPSLSVRTPFGSVNSRGGLSLRTIIPGLSYRITQSSRAEGMRLYKEALDGVQQDLVSVTGRMEELKRFNGVNIQYPTPKYEAVLAEMEGVLADGQTLLSYFDIVNDISRQYNLGLIRKLLYCKKEFEKSLTEIRRCYSILTDGRVEYFKTCVSSTDNPDYIKIMCPECENYIEINTSAKAQHFDCPHCRTLLCVPGLPK